MSALQDLAERVEKATGADRELDCRIFASFSPEEWSQADLDYAISAPDRTVNPPRYTASIDAALYLVPEGWTWGAFDNGTAWAWPNEARDLLAGIRSTAATPALALVSAALRARHFLEQQS